MVGRECCLEKISGKGMIKIKGFSSATPILYAEAMPKPQ
jgi:hypothetical protein